MSYPLLRLLRSSRPGMQEWGWSSVGLRMKATPSVLAETSTLSTRFRGRRWGSGCPSWWVKQQTDYWGSRSCPRVWSRWGGVSCYLVVMVSCPGPGRGGRGGAHHLHWLEAGHAPGAGGLGPGQDGRGTRLGWGRETGQYCWQTEGAPPDADLQVGHNIKINKIYCQKGHTTFLKISFEFKFELRFQN